MEALPQRPGPLQLLTAYNSKVRRWPGALRAALAILIPGSIALLLGYDHAVLLISAGAFAVIYGEGHPYRTRLRVMATAALLLLGASVGGVLVDGGSFDWTVERDGKPVFEQFVTPDPAYHGLKYADLGAAAFGLKARVGHLRDTGAAPSPFNAWVALQGLDTLSLRVERHNENAAKVAEFLADHPLVAKLNYAGAQSSPWFATKEKLGLEHTGSVLSFDIAGDTNDRTAAWAFIDALQLHSNVANIGDVRSLVIHPASTTHSQSDAHGLARAGITQATVRLSVGIESVADIIADLERGFAAAEAVK